VLVVKSRKAYTGDFGCPKVHEKGEKSHVEVLRSRGIPHTGCVEVSAQTELAITHRAGSQIKILDVLITAATHSLAGNTYKV
jgi:hypothetical protein